MLESLLHAFVTLFITIDPVGVVPIFISLTTGATRGSRIRTALTGSLVGGTILLVFGLFGEQVLRALGITLPAFRVAGGILLFLIALEMLFSKRYARKSRTAEDFSTDAEDDDVAIFPLAFPLISGPGAITSIMLLMAENQHHPLVQTGILVTMAVVVSLGAIMFITASSLDHLVHPRISDIVNRILGMLLAALAIQFIFDGVRNYVALIH